MRYWVCYQAPVESDLETAHSRPDRTVGAPAPIEGTSVIFGDGLALSGVFEAESPEAARAQADELFAAVLGDADGYPHVSVVLAGDAQRNAFSVA